LAKIGSLVEIGQNQGEPLLSQELLRLHKNFLLCLLTQIFKLFISCFKNFFFAQNLEEEEKKNFFRFL
jgi:hypothetical protein